MQPPFELFGSGHLLTLAVIAALAAALPWWARHRPAPLQRAVALALASALLLREAVGIPMAVWLYGQPALQALPLHLCGIALFLTVYVLLRRSQAVLEVTYFWAMAGGMQALLTPNLTVGFPHPLYLSFFIGHGLMIVGVIYAMAVFGLRPYPRSIARAAAASLAYLLAMIPVNALLGTNFLYLREKPQQASLLDYLGPWPWYVLSLIGVGFLVLLLYYLPFAIHDRLAARRRRRV